MLTTHLATRTDELFSAWDHPDTPGCALGIVQGGDLVYYRGYGQANLDYGLPITSQTIFDIASTSKQFTAACIALLTEEGKLTLEQDVRHILPELPDYGTTVTVGHLLYHTSGWRDYLELMEFAGYRDKDYFAEAQLSALLQRQRGLNFSPGDLYQYSNTGYYLLGKIVERLTDQSLATFAAEQIFQPLGMTLTHFQDDQTRIVPGRATGYAPHQEGGYRLDMTMLDIVGDGGLMTCVDDLVRWDRNFYQNRLGHGTQDLIRMMTTPGRLNDGSRGTYAFGLDTTPHLGLPCVSHAGWFVGYRAELMRFPEQQFSVICLANTNELNPTALCLQVASLWLDIDTAGANTSTASYEPMPTAETGDPALFAGLYHDGKRDQYVIVTCEDGALSANFGSRPRLLKPLSGGRWRTEPTDYLLELDFQDDQLQVSADGVPYAAYHRVAPSAARHLNRYAGTYYSEELDTTYNIAADDNGLHVRVGYANPHVLRHLNGDTFRMANRTLRFELESSDSARAFVLNSMRVQGIRFERSQTEQT